MRCRIIKSKSGYRLHLLSDNGKIKMKSKKFHGINPCYKISMYFGWAKNEVEIMSKRKLRRIICKK